jgi:hypothetical protein
MMQCERRAPAKTEIGLEKVDNNVQLSKVDEDILQFGPITELYILSQPTTIDFSPIIE